MFPRCGHRLQSSWVRCWVCIWTSSHFGSQHRDLRCKEVGLKESLVNKIIHAEVSSFACYCWWRRQGTKCEMWDTQSKSNVRHVIYRLLEYQKWNTGAACWTDGSPLTHEALFIKNNLCFRFLQPWVPHTRLRIPSPDKQYLLQVWLCSIFFWNTLLPFTAWYTE